MAKRVSVGSYVLPDVTEVEVYALKGDRVYRVLMPFSDWKIFFRMGKVGNLVRRKGWKYSCHQKGHGQYKGVVDLEYKK